jgi:hypothetical protein
MGERHRKKTLRRHHHADRPQEDSKRHGFPESKGNEVINQREPPEV